MELAHWRLTAYWHAQTALFLAFALGCVAEVADDPQSQRLYLVSCSDNADCSGTCVRGTCVPTPSIGSPCDVGDAADCPSGVSCGSDEVCGGIGASCTRNDLCTDRCIDSQCTPMSLVGGSCDVGDDSDCSGAVQCNHEGVCGGGGLRCGDNDQCRGTCRDGYCNPHGDHGDVCDPGDNHDCRGNGVCTAAGACDLAGGGNGASLGTTGQSCGENEDCAGTCVDGRCTDVAAVSEQCDPKDHDDCVGAVECNNQGVCGAGGARCTSNSMCRAVCIGGYCGAASAVGGHCEENADCRSNRCQAGLCVGRSGASPSTVHAAGKIRMLNYVEFKYSDRFMKGSLHKRTTFLDWMNDHMARAKVSPGFWDSNVTGPALDQFGDAYSYTSFMGLTPEEVENMNTPGTDEYLYGGRVNDQLDALGVGRIPPGVTGEDFILRRPNGQRVWLAFNCGRGGGTGCSRYAANISDPNFRKWWVATNRAQLTAGAGYKGFFIDDFNLLFRFSDGRGDPNTGKPATRDFAPEDPATGQIITEAAWRGYVADFISYIDSKFPDAEIVGNTAWPGEGDYVSRSNIRRAFRQLDFVSIEHGFYTHTLRGGDQQYSMSNLIAYIDAIHEEGTNVLVGMRDDHHFVYPTGGARPYFEGSAYSVVEDPMRGFLIASYFLYANGTDLFGTHTLSPELWDSAYEVSLGAPQGDRYRWGALYRRDFAGGIVLANDSDYKNAAAVTVTVDLDETFRDLDGNLVNEVVLAPKAGVVLQRP